MLPKRHLLTSILEVEGISGKLARAIIQVHHFGIGVFGKIYIIAGIIFLALDCPHYNVECAIVVHIPDGGGIRTLELAPKGYPGGETASTIVVVDNLCGRTIAWVRGNTRGIIWWFADIDNHYVKRTVVVEITQGDALGLPLFLTKVYRIGKMPTAIIVIDDILSRYIGGVPLHHILRLRHTCDNIQVAIVVHIPHSNTAGILSPTAKAADFRGILADFP